MIQGDYRPDPWHGNFEALIPMDDGLWHWFRNGATGAWARVFRLTDRPGSVGCITSSDYSANPFHRNFEALVYEPSLVPTALGVLWHFWWDFPNGMWHRAQPLTQMALGPACLIQGDYVKGAAHHNLEALVWERDQPTGRPVLRHYWRDDEHGIFTWTPGVIVNDRVAGPASMIQGDFRPDENHGNFEAICVEVDNEVWHRWRDQPTLMWNIGEEVT
jgi:hypothetical protein